MKFVETPRSQSNPPDENLEEYEAPKVLTYRGEEILQLLGPAQACTFHGSVIACAPSPSTSGPSPIP